MCNVGRKRNIKMPCFWGIGALDFTNQYSCLNYVWLKIRVKNSYSYLKKLKTVESNIVLELVLTVGKAYGAKCYSAVCGYLVQMVL
jgi:hypothetical protein